MASFSEFSLFDDSLKDSNNSKYKSNEKQSKDNNFPQNLKNISIFSLGKENCNFSNSTTNDKTIHNSQNPKIIDNIKEVSSFTLNDNSKPLKRKLNFFSQEELMEIDTIEENDISISDSPIKSKNNKCDNKQSDDDTEEEFDFKYIKRKSRNNFSFATPKFDEDYVIIKTLCKGEMGTVYLCMKFQDRKTYVVKMTNYFSRKFDYYNMKNFLNCINSNDDLPGFKYIQKYIDFWVEDKHNNNSKLSNKSMFIVTDYCIGGDLKDYINKIRKTTINFFN